MGCDNTRTVTAPQDIAPAANTPVGAVRRLEWAFNQGGQEAISGLLTEDMRFTSTTLDSSGNPYGGAWTRDELLASITALMTGNAETPPASNVRLGFEQNLVPFDDTRPGHAGRFHRAVRTHYDFKVVTGSDTLAASETLTCYLTRGDSAQIPQSELARGAAPDSSRWWIDTIEDDAIFAHVGPGPWPPSTLTEILSLWRPRPARP
jgi:hypothetical protein